MRSSDRLGRCTTALGDFTFLAGAACDIHDAGREKPCLQHVRVLYRWMDCHCVGCIPFEGSFGHAKFSH